MRWAAVVLALVIAGASPVDARWRHHHRPAPVRERPASWPTFAPPVRETPWQPSLRPGEGVLIEGTFEQTWVRRVEPGPADYWAVRHGD